MVLNIFLIPVCPFSIVKAIKKRKSSIYPLPAVLGRKGDLLYDINLPESFDACDILPLRLFFFYDGKKKSLLLPSYRIQYLILG